MPGAISAGVGLVKSAIGGLQGFSFPGANTTNDENTTSGPEGTDPQGEEDAQPQEEEVTGADRIDGDSEEQAVEGENEDGNWGGDAGANDEFVTSDDSGGDLGQYF